MELVLTGLYLKYKGHFNSFIKKNKDLTDENIQIEKVLDPNVRGNGNYALVEVKNSSAKKLGAKKAITPLKDITSDKINEAKEGKHRF